jgi:group I intron endonuclease
MDISSNIGIYKILNPKGRVYIGQSTNLKNREKQYKNIKESKGQVKLNRSFKKYGIDNHKFDIVEYCTLEQLDNREIYWGTIYNVLKIGLNCRLGRGRGLISDDLREKMKISNKRKKIKPVLQYDLHGNFIKKWDAVNDAEEYLKVNNNTNISACCLGKQKSAWGYIWRYIDGTIENKIEGIKHTLIINQFDLYGKFIQEWNNVKHITETLGYSYSPIYDCLKGKFKQANGFIWKYKEI